MENDKITKSAAVTDRILKILQGFAIAGVIVSTIFIPLTLIFKERIIANVSVVELGNINLVLAGDATAFLDHSRVIPGIVISLIASILICAILWYGLKVLREVLVPMKDGRPFDQGISAKIRKLAWITLLGGGIAEVVRAVGSAFEVLSYDIPSLFNMANVANVGLNYSISLWFVIVALLLFFLSYVFRYGEQLQRESDETL